MAVNQIFGGGFQDSEGNPLAFGTLVLKLNHDAYTDNTYSTLVCSDQEIEYALDENGNIDGTHYAWPNDQLLDVWIVSPFLAAGVPVKEQAKVTYYMAVAKSADGQLAWGPNAISIPSYPSPFPITSATPMNPA